MEADRRAEAAHDRLLLAAVAGQDQGALRLLYDRHAGLLLSLAHDATGNWGTAEEVVQDVFVQCWYRAETFDPARGKVIGWLIGMTRHRATDSIRRTHAAKRPDASAVPLDTVWPGAAFGPDATESRLDLLTIREALAELPQGERTAIILAVHWGLTQAEIAAALDAPLGTVKSWIRRGLERLPEPPRRDGNGTVNPSQPDGEHLGERLVDLLLGEAEESALKYAEAHLMHCAPCRQELTSLAAAWERVASVRPPPAPSASAWTAIASATAPARGESPPARQVTPPSSRRSTRRAAALVAAAIAAAALGGWWIGADVDDGSDEAPAVVSLGTADLVFTLAPPAPGSSAVGRIFMSDDRARGMVAVAGLPVPSPGRAYVVWLVRNDQRRLNVGTFTVDARGASLSSLDLPELTYHQWHDDYAGLAVTEFDIAAPDQPAGPDLLAGPVY